MTNKVQWRRDFTHRGVELFVFEDNNWKPYTASKLFKPDSPLPGASRGFPTFQQCVKAGYEVVPVDVSYKELDQYESSNNKEGHPKKTE